MDRLVKKIYAAVVMAVLLFYASALTYRYLTRDRLSNPSHTGELILFCMWLAIVAFLLGIFFIPNKRKKDLEEFALSGGFTFDPDAEQLFPLENSGISLFTQGHSREAQNMITGDDSAGKRVRFFDYHYVTGSGRYKNYHNSTLAFFEFDTAVFPVFELRPEKFIDKLGDLISSKDIDITGFDEFSRKYRLTGPDRNAVLGFFNPETVYYFEQNPGWRVEAAGRYMVAFRDNTVQPVNKYSAFMEEVKKLVSGIVKK